MATSDIMAAFLVSVVYPALAAALIWGAGWWFACRRSPRFCWTAVWPNALGLGSSYLVAYLAEEGLPGFPPNASLPWLFYGVVAWTLGVWGLSCSKPPGPVVWALKITLIAGTLYCLLRAMVTYQWSPTEAGAWILGLSLVTLAFWQMLESAARTLQKGIDGWIFLGVLLFSLVTAAVALGDSGSVKLAEFAGALATAWTFYWLLHCLRISIPIHLGGLAPFTLIYLGLLMNGVFYSELPRASALLLLFCPLSVWLYQLAPWRQRWPGPRRVCLFAVLLFCAGLALWLAHPLPETVEYY